MGAGLAMVVAMIVCGIVTSSLLTSVRVASTRVLNVATLLADVDALHQVQERIAVGDDVAFAEFEVPYQQALVLVEGVGDWDDDGSEAGLDTKAYLEHLRSVVRGQGVLAPASAIDAGLRGRLHAQWESVSKLLILEQSAVQRDADSSYRYGLIGIWISVVFASVASLLGVRLLTSVSKRVHSLEASKRADDRVRALVENAPDMVCVLSDDGLSLSYASPAVESVLGYDNHSVSGLGLVDLLHEDDGAAVEAVVRSVVHEHRTAERVSARMRHADGRWVHTEVVLSDQTDDPDIRGVVANIRDVSKQVELQRSLAHQAQHDALTGLTNRAHFVELVQATLHTVGPDDEVSVVYIDLDGFKEINDSRAMVPATRC
ncbi:MAG: PAS domain S-box protein [Ilumatobacteraceae bacterium]